MSEPPHNPDLAVALSYKQGIDAAPKIVAKGRGYMAEKIVALAADNGVVIDANPVLAEALSHVELDQTIPVDLYKAIAEIIGYVMRTREKMR